MWKPVAGLALCVALLGLTGCSNVAERLRKQNAGLTRQLKECREEREALLKNVEALDEDRQMLQKQLVESREEAHERRELVERLRQEQDRLQQQRAELQKLVEGLSGISVETRGEGNFIVVENDILFELGKATLTDQAKGALDEVAGYLRERTAVTIRIDGHTDGVPVKHSPWEDNYHLSVMRAHAVMEYLVSQGVDPRRTYIVGFGPNRPRVEPESPTAPVAENRRVEILLVPRGVRSIGEILQGFEE